MAQKQKNIVEHFLRNNSSTFEQSQEEILKQLKSKSKASLEELSLMLALMHRLSKRFIEENLSEHNIRRDILLNIQSSAPIVSGSEKRAVEIYNEIAAKKQKKGEHMISKPNFMENITWLQENDFLLSSIKKTNRSRERFVQLTNEGWLLTVYILESNK